MSDDQQQSTVTSDAQVEVKESGTQGKKQFIFIILNRLINHDDDYYYYYYYSF
jgi:hypothetical protein